MEITYQQQPTTTTGVRKAALDSLTELLKKHGKTIASRMESFFARFLVRVGECFNDVDNGVVLASLRLACAVVECGFVDLEEDSNFIFAAEECLFISPERKF